MARVFIFTKQVQDILKAGRREIDIPEGASISSAAADLIKENQILVKTVAPNKKDRPDVAQPSKAGDITEQEVEDIVNRVIFRFQQLKGIHPDESKKEDNIPPPQKKDTADDDDLVICRCEEITKGEIKNCIRNGMQTLNGIKRVTRAGMGLCQGQTCQRLVAQILVQERGLSPAEIDPTTARGPVRPLRLEVLANS